MELNYLEIGKRLQSARKDSHLSQQELADMIDVSVSYVKNIERGSKPSLKYLFAVAETCHVSFDKILNDVHVSLLPPPTNFSNEETEFLLDGLRNILNTANPDIRIWAKVQLQKMFGEYLPEKK